MNKFDKIYNESIKKMMGNIFKSKNEKSNNKNLTIINVCRELRLFPLSINEKTSSKVVGKYEKDYMIICFIMNDSISFKVFSKEDEKPLSELIIINVKDDDTEEEIIEKLDNELIKAVGIKFTALSNKIKKSFDKNPIFD